MSTITSRRAPIGKGIVMCYPNPCGKRLLSFLCLNNDPLEVVRNGKAYLFSWTGGPDWVAVNKDGSERLSPVPIAVWDKLDKPPSKIMNSF